MSKKFLLLTIAISALCVTDFNAQSLLDRKLNGIENFHQIMKIVESHYDSIHRLGIESLPGEMKYKHWKRWEWYTSMHLDANGKIANTGRRLYDAAEKLKALKGVDDQSRTTNSVWSFIGPSKSSHSGISSADFPGLGRVDRITFHPSNANIIYIGTPSGGMWKTLDGGSNWIPLTDFMPAIGISGIVIHPDNHNVIYALSGDGDSGLNSSAGILKSNDAGMNWSLISDIDSDTLLRPYNLLVNPDNPLFMWVATDVGLYRSADGGYNWSKLRSGRIWDIELHPTNPSIVYGCTWFDVFRTTNNGLSFSNRPFDVSPAVGRKALAVTPDEPNVLYVITGPQTTGGTFSGFYRSDDSGDAFVQQTTTPNLLGRTGSDENDQSTYDLAIAASPTNDQIVVTGGLIIFKTTDGGTNFSATTSYGQDSEPWYVHPDVHDLQYNPLTGWLYAATDGGLYRSFNNGTTWTDLSEGIETTMFYNMAGYDGDETFLLGGTQDNGMKLRKTNTSDFWHVDCCDGFDAAFDPNTADVAYGSINQWLSKYTNNGTVKTDITPKQHWFMRVATHVSNSQIVFAGADNKLYKSTDQGSTWDTLFVEAHDGIEMCPSNANRMYISGRISGSLRLHRSDNLGAGFDRIDDNPGFPNDPNIYIAKIAVHPSNSNHVWVCLSGFVDHKKVYYSSNAGASWVNWTEGLPNVPFMSIEVQSNGSVFVGCAIGAFYRPAGYSDWIPFNNHLPKTRITELIINEDANLIRAATYGRGVWESPLPNGTCNNFLTWAGNPYVTGYQYFEASNQITTNFQLSGGVNTQVYLKAGDKVVLTPGFIAPASGNIFRAVIGPCNSGWLPEDE